ncbi:MAG: hypothetical protein WC389_17345 [Lutibacter sp.]|jgi:hypothetical protein
MELEKVKSFSEIYNKRRTRIVKEEIKTQEQQDVTPKEIYIEDINGNFVRLSNLEYIDKSFIHDQLYVFSVGGGNWNRKISNPESSPKIIYFRKEAYIGKPKYETITKIDYKSNSIRDKNIVGTALAFTSALWEFILSSKVLWAWFRGLITDGYFMILLSPFILTYWVLVTILYVPLFLILSILVVLSMVHTIVFEFPAGFMNKETNQFFED